MKRLAVVFLAFLALLIAAGPSLGQEQQPEPTPTPDSAHIFSNLSPEVRRKIAEGLATLITLEPEDPSATLTLRNTPVATYRARRAGNPPQARVSNAERRFAEVIGGRMDEVPAASVETLKGGVIFLVGGEVVLGLSEMDLDPMEGDSLEDVSRETLDRLNRVLDGIREERSLRHFLRALTSTGVATLILAVSIWVLALLMRRLRQWVARGEEAVKTVVGPGGVPSAEVGKISNLTKWMFTLAIWATRIFLFFTWLAFSLGQFPYTRPWGDQMGGFVVATLKGLALGMIRAIPNIFTVIIIFLMARLLVRVVKHFFEAVEDGKIDMPWIFPETAIPTRKILIFVVWVFAIVAAYPYLPGSESEAFKGLSVLLGLMISLGGSGVISQAMGGLVLMYSRALRAGDYVRIGEVEGVVTALGMMATKIRTGKREEITIPNSVVLSTSTKNFTRLAGEEGVILHTTVTIGYSDPWRKVHEVLIEAARRTAGLRKAPEPFVMQTGLSDFYVEYQLNAYLEAPEKRPAVLAALHANIQDSFNEAGIAIVSPHYVADPPNPMPKKEEPSPPS